MDRGQDAGRLRLDDLGTTDLPSFYGYKGVVGHVLGLKGCDPKPPPPEYPAEGCSSNRFTHVTARAQKHDGFAHGGASREMESDLRDTLKVNTTNTSFSYIELSLNRYKKF